MQDPGGGSRRSDTGSRHQAITTSAGNHPRFSHLQDVPAGIHRTQKVTVALEDDLDGGPADETVRFGLDGTAYEIDLSSKNARRFRKQLTPFIEHARKAARGPARRAARTPVGRQRSSDIRAWAKDHGIEVSDRGRIPATVVEQYQAAAKGS